MPSTYTAPWWLIGAHAQTIYPFVMLKRAPPRYRRERWELADGDFIDLDFIDGPDAAPLVVLFHGLEGSSSSHYAVSLMRAVAARGWRGVVPHFRGCSGTPNRLPRAYHSGDAQEIHDIVKQLVARSSAPLLASGVSLGGNALLKWLARDGDAARQYVAACVAVCAPVDLVAAGAALRKGFNKVYTREFLRTLKPKTLAKLNQYPQLFDRARLMGSTDFDSFDDAFTAPVHGYSGVMDYWQRASTRHELHAIQTPTLIINSLNDPFLPAEYLPSNADVSSHVELEQPGTGGHVGFVSGPFPGNLDWLPRRILSFFDNKLAASHPKP